MINIKKVMDEKYSDQCIEALEIEKEIFLDSLGEKYIIARNGCDIYITNKNESNDEQVCLRGDNLITRKQMYLRFFSRKEYLKSEIENDEHIYSFVLMPHIKGRNRCQLNSKRATVKEYSDNPFVFYSVLEALFKVDFQKHESDLDGVEKWIVENKNFWNIFGKGERGFLNYLDCFCLKCIKDIRKHENYCKKYDLFFEKREIEKSENDWNSYNSMLELFMELRCLEVKKKVDCINNLATCPINDTVAFIQ